MAVIGPISAFDWSRVEVHVGLCTIAQVIILNDIHPYQPMNPQSLAESVE